MTQLSSQKMDITHIGHYTILGAIGRGGMGLVYLARDTRLDRQVAIKCLRTELIEPHYRERFKREALLLAKLNHPNIVQIYDYVETEEQLALVMEYVNGQNLQQHLREHITPLAQRMQWLAQIAQGLATAHDAGIIHRDLKAENILINPHKLAKITDLGIAKSQDFNATLTDHVTGSYGSMSPEQAMGEELDFRSDLFSFGILAYQLLCGAHPFGETENKLQLMQRIISHPPIAPTKKNPDLPPEAVELLGQLLSKNPDERPANTHWVAAQCEKLYQLIAAISVFDSDSTQILSHSQSGHSGIRNTNITGKGQNTQEHPTFEANLKKPKAPLRTRFTDYIRANSLTVFFIVVSLVMVGGGILWQLQPKPPRYVAVLPPNLTTDGMQESQQELVKGAVYDAIQQSVLQLNGYYLIPQNEIADINAAPNKEGIETVRRATAADELITTDIQCKIEACTITLSRLTPDGKTKESRLRVQDTKTVDVLTDNYLSVATIVQSSIGGLYSEDVSNVFANTNEKDYAVFLEINRIYREQGANQHLLDVLDALNTKTKVLPAVQTLFTDIALDLHYETQNSIYLEKMEELLALHGLNHLDTIYERNLFLLHIAKKNFKDADKNLERLKSTKISNAALNELYAYSKMAQKDYSAAAQFYQNSLSLKKTANGLYYLSMAFWYQGKNTSAKAILEESLNISPNFYKSHNLLGLINLVVGNIPAATTALETAIRLKPNDSITLNNLGLCYLLTKKYALALEKFSLANKLVPNNTAHMLNEADAYELLGNKVEAKKLYEKIAHQLENLEQNNENLIHLSQAHAHLGNFSEALKYLQNLEKIDPQNYRTTYTAALVHTLAKNNASAILNIDNSINIGMNKIWFTFPWFNQLCAEQKYIELMQKIGEPNRCTPQNSAI